MPHVLATPTGTADERMASYEMQQDFPTVTGEVRVDGMMAGFLSF